jgi:hypothetical protein
MFWTVQNIALIDFSGKIAKQENRGGGGIDTQYSESELIFELLNEMVSLENEAVAKKIEKTTTISIQICIFFQKIRQISITLPPIPFSSLKTKTALPIESPFESKNIFLSNSLYLLYIEFLKSDKVASLVKNTEPSASINKDRKKNYSTQEQSFAIY